MRVLRSIAAAGALFGMTAPALAETSAKAVWQMFQDGVAEAGGSLTAKVRQRGDGLVVAGGRLALRSGAVVMLPDLTLREVGDGSVGMDLPNRFALVIDLPDRPGDPDRVELTVATVDLFASFRDIGPEVVEATLAATSITAALAPSDETARALVARSGIAGAAEARVAISGALRFDSAKPFILSGFDSSGFPAPEGVVTVEMAGARALLDGLDEIGASSGDDLLGLRMLFAAATRPSGGPDQVMSEIDFRAGGTLFVNGVQLQ